MNAMIAELNHVPVYEIHSRISFACGQNIRVNDTRSFREFTDRPESGSLALAAEFFTFDNEDLQTTLQRWAFITANIIPSNMKFYYNNIIFNLH